MDRFPPTTNLATFLRRQETHGHFYASADAAAEWRAEHPDGDVRPVGEFCTRALAAQADPGGSRIRVELTYVADCPNAGAVRERLHAALRRTGLPDTVEERVDDTRPSPSVLINGDDVLGAPVQGGHACRVNLPTEADLVAALQRHTTTPDHDEGL